MNIDNKEKKNIVPVQYSILNNLPMGIFIIDIKSIVMFWNSTMSNWTGVTSADSVGKIIYDIFPSLKVDFLQLRLESLFTDGLPILLTPNIHKPLFHSRKISIRKDLQTIISPIKSDNKGSFDALFTIKDVSVLFSQINQAQKERNRALEEIKRRRVVEAELKEANKKLEFLSITDELTGLINRREMLDRIVFEVSRFKRNKKIFSVIMMDIDNFKLFNDQYGHDMGDFVLVNATKVIQKCLRSTDMVARWGGEEFFCILPETTGKDCLSVAEKIRQTLASEKFEYNNFEVSITMTLGVTEYHQSDLTLHSTINRADKALLDGKRQSKNTVIYAAPY